MIKLVEFNPRNSPHFMGSQGTLRLLNDSEDDSLTIMLREAVQNSWDARLSDSNGINFEVRGYALDQDNVNSLSSLFGSSQNSDYGFELYKKVRDNRNILEISDSETYGLTGSTGFNTVTLDVQQRYRKFVYEVGKAQNLDAAGGSYGFGKVSFFRLSKIGFICTYSRTKVNGKLESRVIFKCTDRMNDAESDNTGVYWWGKKLIRPNDINASPWVEPLRNSEADSVWQSLGGSVFNHDSTGTKVLVFMPSFSEGDPDKPVFLSDESWALETLSRSMLHYFWAKWPDGNGNGGIRFKIVDDFSGDTKYLNLDHPQDTKPYSYLLKCLKAAKNPDNASEKIEVFPVECGSPVQNLGKVALKIISENDVSNRYVNYFRGTSTYVALMRNVEFVVNYLNSQTSVNDYLQDEEDRKLIIGVFRTLDNKLVKKYREDKDPIDLNEIYRRAENQTHGKWIASNVKDLGDWCKTYISVTENKINSSISRFSKSKIERQAPAASDARIKFMSFLGQYIEGAPGGGQPALACPPRPNNGEGAGTSRNGQRKITELIIKDSEIVSERRGKFVKIDCLLSSSNSEDRVVLTLVCADEEGNFSIKSDRKNMINLPVRIDSIVFSEGTISDIRYNTDGSASLVPKSENISLTVSVEVLGECHFTIKSTQF